MKPLLGAEEGGLAGEVERSLTFVLETVGRSLDDKPSDRCLHNQLLSQLCFCTASDGALGGRRALRYKVLQKKKKSPVYMHTVGDQLAQDSGNGEDSIFVTQELERACLIL